MENISNFRELSEKEREALRRVLKKHTDLNMDGGKTLNLNDEESGEAGEE